GDESMTLTTTAMLLGLALAAVVSWQLDGAARNGALAGATLGAAVTAWGLARQRRMIRTHPAGALRALVEGFLVKLAVIVVATLVLLLTPLRAALHLGAFPLAFSAAAP